MKSIGNMTWQCRKEKYLIDNNPKLYIIYELALGTKPTNAIPVQTPSKDAGNLSSNIFIHFSRLDSNFAK
jgi:hypothetical protein